MKGLLTELWTGLKEQTKDNEPPKDEPQKEAIAACSA